MFPHFPTLGAKKLRELAHLGMVLVSTLQKLTQNFLIFSNDYLFIDGHGKYCGKINYRKHDEYGFSDPLSPPNFMYSTGNSLSINFHSNHEEMYSRYSERGFELRYETGSF